MLRKTYQDVSGVGDGSDDSSSDHKLFPGLSNIDNVNSFVVAFVNVRFHQARAVLSTNVNLKNQALDMEELHWQQALKRCLILLSLSKQSFDRNSYSLCDYGEESSNFFINNN
jgi:hypothetical protein